MPRRIATVAAFLISTALVALAGGPAFVAGSGYNLGVEGQPLIWANGSVAYFTDQGDLSPILPAAQADAFVAAAFSAWTTIPGTILTASPAGQLAEDVNGSNIQTNGLGVVTSPADITSTAAATPVGIVYDYDGTVTDAILGEGAGDSADCFTNAVYGGPDNFSAAGNIVHSLVVINGVCATTDAQLPDVQYRLVRVLGRTLGLGWSQANLNVITQKPPPTQDDYVGFPVMHYIDPISCVPISVCYPDATTPKMDDMDSLAKLYPGAQPPQPSGRVYGSVYFTDASGNAVQPMQGINVVARLMVSGQPSGQYVATSVSGFLFCGNAGNIIDGYIAPNGLPYSQWGSGDPTLEGFFDLGQLPIPSGQSTAQYQLSVEALDPIWSLGVEPYGPFQVTPSGSFAPVVVTVSNGSNAERDILMLQDEIAEQHPGSGSTYANPAQLPQSGAWGSWTSGYGSVDYFQFTAQANRTASISVFALNEAGQPTENKLLPVIGIWQLSDQTGDPAPASTPSAFNTTTFAMTRLDAQFNETEAFRVAVGDFRGDGRPDYFYQASLLYSDSLTPPRLSLAGGVTTLNGVGFAPRLQVSVNGGNGTTLSALATQIQAMLPSAARDGLATVQVTDPVTAAFSQMQSVLTYGASATDLLQLLQGAEPSTPVGAQAANPIRVRAVAFDGVTPVNGATIAWSATNGLLFSVCGGASSCFVLTDEAGESSSWVTPKATGPSTVTVALAPASYSSPQTQQATVVGTSTTLDLAAVTPTRWIGQGATLSVPLTVEALDLGAPLANVTVNFVVTKGTASLSAGSATTNGSGLATVTASLTNLSANVQVSACAAPGNSPCVTFTLFSTSSSLWTLQQVSGSSQVVPVGQLFQPLAMRVTDGSGATNPVMGVNVIFATTLARVPPGQGGPGGGDGMVAEDGEPIILGYSQAEVVTDQNGLATIVPSGGNVGPCDVFITVTAGSSTAQLQLEVVASITAGQPKSGHTKSPPSPSLPRSRAQAAVSSAVPSEFFAVPEIVGNIPNNDDPSADDPSIDCANQSPGNADSAVQPCDRSAPPEPQTSPPAPAPAPVVDLTRPAKQPAHDSAPSAATSAKAPVDATFPDTKSPDKTQPSARNPPDATIGPAAAESEIYDRRTCRFAQTDAILPP